MPSKKTVARRKVEEKERKEREEREARQASYGVQTYGYVHDEDGTNEDAAVVYREFGADLLHSFPSPPPPPPPPPPSFATGATIMPMLSAAPGTLLHYGGQNGGGLVATTSLPPPMPLHGADDVTRAGRVARASTSSYVPVDNIKPTMHHAAATGVWRLDGNQVYCDDGSGAHNLSGGILLHPPPPPPPDPNGLSMPYSTIDAPLAVLRDDPRSLMYAGTTPMHVKESRQKQKQKQKQVAEHNGTYAFHTHRSRSAAGAGPSSSRHAPSEFGVRGDAHEANRRNSGGDVAAAPPTTNIVVNNRKTTTSRAEPESNEIEAGEVTDLVVATDACTDQGPTCTPTDTKTALHMEISEFCKGVTPSKATRNRVVETINTLLRSIRRLYRHATLDLYGSQATGMQLPNSDIDLTLSNVIPASATRAAGHSSRYNKDERREIVSALTRIQRLLTTNNIVRKGVLIASARIPVLKMVDSFGCNIDLSIGSTNGIEALPVVIRFRRAYKPLRPLCLVIKAYLKEKGLNEVYNGGVGSFMLINMIVAHLQSLESTGINDHGVLLRAFFDLYGNAFSYPEVRMTPSSQARHVSCVCFVCVLCVHIYYFDGGRLPGAMVIE